jgi:hypothetical protein
MSANRLRLAAAIVLGPIIGAVVFAIILRLLSFPLTSPIATVVDIVAMALPLALGLGIPGMLILGLPAHSMLVKAGQRSLLMYAIAGLIAGVFVACLFLCSVWLYDVGSDSPGQLTSDHLFTVLLFAIPLGGLSAAIFWVIRRPDRDQASSASGNETSA